METLTWLLTFTALITWLLVGVGVLRSPPAIPRVDSAILRRLLWLLLWGTALVLGSGGPELWARTDTDFSRDPEVGVPVEGASGELRTPFAVETTRRDLDAEGRLIRADRRLALRLPVGLLLFFGLMGWLRYRERSRDPSRSEPAGVGMAALLPFLLLAGCQEGERASGSSDRVFHEVAWDTILHLQVPADDTLLFGADQVIAREEGLWVLDRVGHRLAHLDWEGSLQWYAGRRGVGPGELLNPRVVSLDESNSAWILDHGTGRITGFDAAGRFHDEVTPFEADGILGAMVVSLDGNRFLGMVHPVDLHAAELDRTGRVRQGPPLLSAEEEGTFNFAFQGAAAREPEGDRWVYALSMGDGMFRMEGTRLLGERIRFPEHIPFSRMEETVRTEGNRTVTTRQLTEPNFSAASVAVAEGRILINFMGETEDRGRILDIFDFETGAYERSILLPRGGQLAAWKDRILLAYNDPTPGILALRVVE